MKSEKSLLGPRRFNLRHLVCTGMLVSCLSAGASIYTVTLPNGATNTLAEAFSNGYVTGEDSPTMAGLYAAEDLRVTGGGRLEINVDLKSAGFAGEVHVLTGATLRLTAMGALGDTAHGTFVEDGATLETECLDTSAINKLDFAGEKLSFAGEGVNGVGALVARTPSTQERNGVWGGTVLTMTGDAKITQVGQYQDFPCNSTSQSLNMNGHTLTFFDTNGVGEFCVRAIVTNPGHFVVTNALMTINDYANLGGDASNTLTVHGTGRVDLYSNTTVGRKKWTLRIAEDCTTWMPLTTSNVGGVWDGPIVTENATVFAPLGQKTSGVESQNETKFIGPISAPKRLVIRRRDNTVLRAPNVELHSTANAFAEGLVVSNVNLKVLANGALPASMGTDGLTVENVALAFADADSSVSWNLPAMKVRGTVSVGDRSGTWAGIATAAGASLTCSANSPTFTTLDLASGTMTLEEPNRYFNVGLAEGHKAYAYWYKDNVSGDFRANAHCDGADNCHTNQITSTVRLAYESETFSEKVVNESGATVDANGYAVSYTGYIWNHDPTNVTWTFAASENTVSKLFINNRTVYDRQSTGASPENGNNADLRWGNATLTPGANHFWWRIGVSGKSPGPRTSVSSCATWTDKSKYGLVYDRLGRNTPDPAYFERLVNSADGNLFTLTDTNSTAYADLKETATVRRLERLSGTAGAILNAPSRTLEVVSVVGCPEVNVASTWLKEAGLSVTESLVSRVSDLASGHHLATDGKLSFTESCTFELEGDMKPLQGTKTVLATAAEGIEGVPTAVGETAASFRIVKSADAKTLYLEYIPNGTLVIFR